VTDLARRVASTLPCVPGETPLETAREPRPADDLVVTIEPAGSAGEDEAVTAGDIDPLMGDNAPTPGPMKPASPSAARTGTKRRWWQRIIEWDEPGPNGQPGNGHAPTDVGAEANVARWDAEPVGSTGAADAVDPLAGWAAEGGAAAADVDADASTPAADAQARAASPRVADPTVVEAEPTNSAVDDPEASAAEIDEERWQWTPVPAVDLVPASEREAASAREIDDRELEADSEWDDWAVAPGTDGTDGTAGSPSAWATVPLTDLPDGADPDVLDAPELEPARTGEFPRVPMLAAERARLEPEPQPEPTWLQRRRAHRPRVRRVTRIVRRIDTWTVFKLSLLFWAVAYLILLVAGVLLWSVAISTGTVDNVESFIKDLLALDSFTFDGQKIFRASWVLGAFMAVAGTGLTVTMAVLYNLFADLVGGVRVTVLEEEVVQRPPTRRSV